MFDPSFNWHFTKPEPYKHHFLAFSKQLANVAALPPRERVQAIDSACRAAFARYRALDQAGVLLEPDSAGEHLPAWVTALNRFAASAGLR